MKQAVAKLQEENQVRPIKHMSSSRIIQTNIKRKIRRSTNLVVIKFQFTVAGDRGSQ